MSRRKRIGARLTDDQQEYLEHGDILTGCTLAETFGDLATARAAWMLHREELMPSCRPGERPLAWWLFEAPEWRHLDKAAPPRPALPELGPSGYFMARPDREEKILSGLGLLTDAEQDALRQQRTQPETVDPLADALPMTRLYFPQLDGDSNRHDTNGNHDY